MTSKNKKFILINLYIIKTISSDIGHNTEMIHLMIIYLNSADLPLTVFFT